MSAPRPRFLPPQELPDAPLCPRCREPIHGYRFRFPPVERPDPDHPGKTVGVFEEAPDAEVRRGEWRCFPCLVPARRDYLARQEAVRRASARQTASQWATGSTGRIDPASPVARMVEHAIRQASRKRIIPIAGESAGTRRDPTLDQVVGGENRRERSQEEAPRRHPLREEGW